MVAPGVSGPNDTGAPDATVVTHPGRFASATTRLSISWNEPSAALKYFGLENTTVVYETPSSLSHVSDDAVRNNANSACGTPRRAVRAVEKLTGNSSRDGARNPGPSNNTPLSRSASPVTAARPGARSSLPVRRDQNRCHSPATRDASNGDTAPGAGLRTTPLDGDPAAA